jgi:hypothetical protein
MSSTRRRNAPLSRGRLCVTHNFFPSYRYKPRVKGAHTKAESSGKRICSNSTAARSTDVRAQPSPSKNPSLFPSPPHCHASAWLAYPLNSSFNARWLSVTMNHSFAWRSLPSDACTILPLPRALQHGLNHPVKISIRLSNTLSAWEAQPAIQRHEVGACNLP